MLRREGGVCTPFITENASPCACPCPWYGSWPMMTTLTLLSGHRLNAENMSLAGGYTFFPAFSSWFKNVSRPIMYGFLNSGASACRHPSSMASKGAQPTNPSADTAAVNTTAAAAGAGATAAALARYTALFSVCASVPLASVLSKGEPSLPASSPGPAELLAAVRVRVEGEGTSSLAFLAGPALVKKLRMDLLMV
eukprot:CAMPEP_0173244360 /NCGR_PEP_ID=MMETSP1142-20121109/16052_1 /TAXON_ID=483371 /ORGANISM="non described non described, Strain CCMP2298" /LENGTH=194 /DNA_ID=CAMNT_0014176131 /DNA_START=523 /DNA_END=1107 /DNA_ORIENTATION=-